MLLRKLIYLYKPSQCEVSNCHSFNQVSCILSPPKKQYSPASVPQQPHELALRFLRQLLPFDNLSHLFAFGLSRSFHHNSLVTAPRLTTSGTCISYTLRPPQPGAAGWAVFCSSEQWAERSFHRHSECSEGTSLASRWELIL